MPLSAVAPVTRINDSHCTGAPGGLLTLIQPEEREERKTIISIDMTELSETVSQWTLDNIQDRKPPPLVTSVMLLG